MSSISSLWSVEEADAAITASNNATEITGKIVTVEEVTWKLFSTLFVDADCR